MHISLPDEVARGQVYTESCAAWSEFILIILYEHTVL